MPTPSARHKVHLSLQHFWWRLSQSRNELVPEYVDSDVNVYLNLVAGSQVYVPREPQCNDQIRHAKELLEL